MSKSGYQVVCGGDVVLAAATPKSILGIKSGGTFGLDLIEASVSFDGITAAAVPVLVELCYCTFATNSPGTNSTSVTPVQVYGRAITHGMTAARAWSSEPTVVSVFDEMRIHPQSGVIYPISLGQTPDCAPSEGFVIRCTAAATVNTRAKFKAERC